LEARINSTYAPKKRDVTISLISSTVSKRTPMNMMNTNPEDEVMCQCSGTRKGNIRTLFEQGMDIDAISRWTGALSGCGGCEWDIAEFLQELSLKASGEQQAK